MSDTITVDVDGLSAIQVGEIVETVRRLREQNAVTEHEQDDETWRDAPSTGWTLEHVEELRANLKARGKTVQLEAFDLAIKNGGFVSREQVYAIGGYAPTRKLNNWTAPINNFSETLVETSGLPQKADYPIETAYGEGTGYRPAIGFTVAPEIVKLVRESEH